MTTTTDRGQELGTTVINEKGQLLSMAPEQESDKKDNVNNYLTWMNVLKIMLAACGLLWFYSTQLRDDSVSNTVRDLKLEQISADVKVIMSNQKENQAENKANDSQMKDRLSTVEADMRILRNDVNEMKNK